MNGPSIKLHSLIPNVINSLSTSAVVMGNGPWSLRSAPEYGTPSKPQSLPSEQQLYSYETGIRRRRKEGDIEATSYATRTEPPRETVASELIREDTELVFGLEDAKFTSEEVKEKALR